MTNQQANPAPGRSERRRAPAFADLFAQVGEFYRHPEPSGERGHIVSLLVLGSATLLLSSIVIPYVTLPFGGPDAFLYLSGLTVLLGLVSVLRRERGPIGAAAALVAAGTAGLVLLMLTFAFSISGLLRLAMPN